MARILVVDDDPDILNLVDMRLRRAGHRVLTAGCAGDALAAVAEKGAPDVAVVDITMPDMNGMELVEELRRCPGLEGLPVVFLSASIQPDDIAAGRAVGAMYLTKPFVTSALLKAVDESIVPVEGGEW